MVEFSFRAPRQTSLLVCSVLVVVAALVAAVPAYRIWAAHSASHLSTGNPGPWGRLLHADVPICLPDEFIVLPSENQPPASWFFKGCTRSQVLDLLDKAGVSSREHEEFSRDGQWTGVEGGIRLTPADKTVLGLSPRVRGAIYATLLAVPENAEIMDPVWFAPETVDRQLADNGLADKSIALLKRLLYQNVGSPLLMFADRDVAMRQLPDDRERRLFIKAVSQKNAVMARLEITRDSPIEALAAYWGGGGRGKDLVPLLRSLQKADGQWNASIAYLLPPFMRSHLNTYPFPSSEAGAVKQDCFWTAFNALSAEPDNRLNDMQYVRELLDRDYYTIFEPSHLGDIVFIATADSQVIHAAVFVADDLVFTKNGYHYTQPWILMHIRDMVATYTARYPGSGALKLLYYRS